MKNLILLLFLITTLNFNTKSQNGEWFGLLEKGEGVIASRLRMESDKMSFRIYSLPEENWEISNYKDDSGRVSWTMSDPVRSLQFSGTIDSMSQDISGFIKDHELQYPLKLYRRIPSEDISMDRFTGFYRSGSGDIFQVNKNRRTLHIHSPISGSYCVLKCIDPNQFLTRTAEKFIFSVLKEEKMQQLTWQDMQGRHQEAVRFDPYRQEEVRILTSIDTLYGTLYLPNNTLSESPCIMLALGAGRYDRWSYALEASMYAARGYASLIIDFPGTGKSGGNLHDRSFDQKSRMTTDILKWLQNHKHVDRHKIIIRGGSQSGRIAIMAAADQPEVAGILAVNAPIQSFIETQLFAIEQHLRQRSVDEITIVQATSLWYHYYHQIHEGKIEQELLDKISDLASSHPDLYLPPSNSAVLPRSPLQADIYSSPLAELSSIKCPVLFQLGTADERVPHETVTKNIGLAIERNPENIFTVIEYEMANHNMMLPGYRIAHNFFMDQIDWLKSNYPLDKH